MAFTVKTYTACATGHAICGPFIETFPSAAAAERHATEEMKWESTVAVVIPELGICVEGDFLGVSFPRALLDKVPRN